MHQSAISTKPSLPIFFLGTLDSPYCRTFLKFSRRSKYRGGSDIKVKMGSIVGDNGFCVFSTWFSLPCSRSVIKYQIFSRIQMFFLKKFKLFCFIPFPQIQYIENHLFFESWNSLKMDSKSNKKIHHSTEGGGRWVNFSGQGYIFYEAEDDIWVGSEWVREFFRARGTSKMLILLPPCIVILKQKWWKQMKVFSCLAGGGGSERLKICRAPASFYRVIFGWPPINIPRFPTTFYW